MKATPSVRWFGPCATVALLLAGCDASPGFSKNAKSPSQQEAVGNATTSSAAAPLGNGNVEPAVETSSLSVSSEIAKACGIQASSNVAPSFEYDSATLGDDDRKMLGQLAKCLTEGALKGRSVQFIGRADPRGEDEYNMTLGGSRANTVRRYVKDLGVGIDRMSSTSRGEIDAIGKDEAGWAKDRRVDVELAK